MATCFHMPHMPAPFLSAWTGEPGRPPPILAWAVGPRPTFPTFPSRPLTAGTSSSLTSFLTMEAALLHHALTVSLACMLCSACHPSCQTVKFESVVDVTVSLDSHFDSLVFAYGFKIDTFRSINITWAKVSVSPTLGGIEGDILQARVHQAHKPPKLRYAVVELCAPSAQPCQLRLPTEGICIIPHT